MKVVFLGHAHTNGCRSAYYFPHLAARGILAEYMEIPSGPGRARSLAALPRADCVVVQRLALSLEELTILRGRSPRLVYDVDDPIMYRSSRHLLQRSFARRRRFARMASAVDALIAGTPLIAREATRYLPPGRVALIPSTVDAEVYRPADGAEASGGGTGEPPETVRLGWLGSAGTIGYLARLRRVLAEVGRRHPGVSLTIVSNRFPDIDGLPVRRKAWRQEDEVEDLRSFDVALLPLSDDLWTRGKGHGKLFQYMAVGAAIAASPVGIVADAIEDGRTGILARTGREWVEALSRLVADRALRRRLGGAARRAFETRFSLQATLPTLLRTLGAPMDAPP